MQGEFDIIEIDSPVCRRLLASSGYAIGCDYKHKSERTDKMDTITGVYSDESCSKAIASRMWT